MPHAGDAVLGKCEEREEREESGREIKMNRAAVNKRERERGGGGARRESVKEIQNTSYNSHFQKTTQSLAEASLYRGVPPSGQARVFRRRKTRRSNLVSSTSACTYLARKVHMRVRVVRRSDKNSSRVSQEYFFNICHSVLLVRFFSITHPAPKPLSVSAFVTANSRIMFYYSLTVMFYYGLTVDAYTCIAGK